MISPTNGSTCAKFSSTLARKAAGSPKAGVGRAARQKDASRAASPASGAAVSAPRASNDAALASSGRRRMCKAQSTTRPSPPAITCPRALWRTGSTPR